MSPLPRSSSPLLIPLALGISMALAGCDDVGLLQPQDAEEVRITLSVSGGIGGIGYTVAVDGARREVIGVSCEWWCSVEPGGVILPVSAEQVATMANALEDAGILKLDGQDFGIDCCDQFGVGLQYRKGDRTFSVSGGVTRLPPALMRVVRGLDGLVEGIIPALISPYTTETDWPRDGYTLGPTSVDGLEFTAELQYGGGCGQHRMDLVILGDWITTASSPPHVDALVTHDDGGDVCDALVTEERTFHLTPLRDAYERSFGPLGDEHPTVVLRLWDPLSTNPLGRLVEVRL